MSQAVRIAIKYMVLTSFKGLLPPLIFQVSSSKVFRFYLINVIQLITHMFYTYTSLAKKSFSDQNYIRNDGHKVLSLNKAEIRINNHGQRKISKL